MKKLNPAEQLILKVIDNNPPGNQDFNDAYWALRKAIITLFTTGDVEDVKSLKQVYLIHSCALHFRIFINKTNPQEQRVCKYDWQNAKMAVDKLAYRINDAKFTFYSSKLKKSSCIKIL